MMQEKSMNGCNDTSDMNEKCFAVIDTETTWDNLVMSIGVVIADKDTKDAVDVKYFVITPEYKMGGMYSHVLDLPGIKETIKNDRNTVIKEIDRILKKSGVKRILAYNACFDKKHLPELNSYVWCDIMRLAAYRQYNSKMPKSVECCSTGKMKRGYGVEQILRMLSGDNHYVETHNAYFDALDELKIIQLLGHNLEKYDLTIV